VRKLMSVELTCLFWSVLLALVYLSTQTFYRKAELGVLQDVGPRDNEQQVQGKVAGRADRAWRNFQETWPAFIALVAVIEFSGASDAFTQWGAMIYLAFRVIYLPLYLIGVRWVRTFSWNIATAGIAAMFVGVLI
jgi:uncharacterized MAPEG superfamily protein